MSRVALVIGWVVIVVAIHFIPAVHDKLTRGRIHHASIWIPFLLIVWFVVLNAVVGSVRARTPGGELAAQVGSRRESVGKHRPWRDQHSGGLVHV